MVSLGAFLRDQQIELTVIASDASISQPTNLNKSLKTDMDC